MFPLLCDEDQGQHLEGLLPTQCLAHPRGWSLTAEDGVPGDREEVLFQFGITAQLLQAAIAAVMGMTAPVGAELTWKGCEFSWAGLKQGSCGSKMEVGYKSLLSRFPQLLLPPRLLPQLLLLLQAVLLLTNPSGPPASWSHRRHSSSRSRCTAGRAFLSFSQSLLQTGPGSHQPGVLWKRRQRPQGSSGPVSIASRVPS